MSDHDRERSVVVARADELLRPATRRGFLRMLGVGGSVVLLPSVFTACSDDDDDDNGGVVTPPPTQPPPANSVTFDLRTDVGIFRLLNLQEQLEAAFYSAVVGASNFATLFTDAGERELFTDLRNVEVLHLRFVEAALGTAKLPDLTAQLNQTFLTQALASRESIVQTARLLETQGLAAINGAGKYIKDARNLLIGGKLASVEARHLAALRDIPPVPSGTNANTAFAGDDSVDNNGLGIKIEAGVVIDNVKTRNVFVESFEPSISISNPPAASQGAPTPNFIPTLP